MLYFRKVDARQYADKPGYMRHGGLAKAVEALVKSGLAIAITGKKMPWWSETQSWASSYSASDMLVDIAVRDFGLSKDSIVWQVPSDRLVRLYGPKPKALDYVQGKVHACRGKAITFDPTDETKAWVAALESINAFYSRQKIEIGLGRDELETWVGEYNARRPESETHYRQPETFRTDLYRVFNSGDEADPTFDQGGRLYGGWWISVPKGLRKAITINGQSTVELDYASCHPRMLYHQRGLDVEGDIYVIPDIAAYERDTGVEVDTYRPFIKWMTQVLLNSKGRPQKAEKPEDIAVPLRYSLNELIGFIKASHGPIADAFGTGVGLKLMKQESDIALEIILAGIERGFTVLPVHDSFITAADNKEELEGIMKDIYHQKFGRLPTVR